MLSNLRIYLSFLFLGATLCSWAQTTLHGTLRDAAGGPMSSVTVRQLGTQNGTSTDSDGHFALAVEGRLPVSLIFSCVGFRTDTLEVRSAMREVKHRMESDDIVTEQVDVVGHKKDVGFDHIDVGVAANLTGVSGGVEGVVKQQMGVSSNSELSSQYRVRGGSFDENIVYVNGIEIFRPFLIRAGEQEGLSFVNPDMVHELRFSAGGFDASYGDKLSSVLDVTYKRPKSTHWSARASLLGAQGHIEGAAAGGRLTHITGVRYKTNQYLFGSLDTKGDYAPSFLDVQTYWTFTPREKTTIGLLAYYSANKYKFIPHDRETSFGTISDAKTLNIYFEGGENDRYRTCVTALDVSSRPSERLRWWITSSMFRTVEEENFDILGEYWLQQAAASQSSTSVDQSEGIGVGGYLEHARNDLFGEVYSATAGAQISFAKCDLKTAFSITREHYSDYTDEWEFTDSAGYIGSYDKILMSDVRYAHGSLWRTRTDAYVVADGKPLSTGEGLFTWTAGARIACSQLGNISVLSPRVSIGYSLDRWRFRLSGGRYVQLPQLREMKDGRAALHRGLEAQKSWQVIGGADLYFGSSTRQFKFTAEAYYKWMTDVNPYSIENVRLRYMADNCAKAYAAGVDFKLNGELVEGVDSWITMSLMKTMEDVENDGHGYIPRPSDQRFQFSMMVQDYMPSNRSITGMLSMYFASGLPFGPAGCERWQAVSRMPGYKRVDFGVYKDFARGKKGEITARHLHLCQLGVEVFNLFDFANTISHFWVSDAAGHKYGVPNYLTSRRINVKLSVEF